MSSTIISALQVLFANNDLCGPVTLKPCPGSPPFSPPPPFVLPPPVSTQGGIVSLALERLLKRIQKFIWVSLKGFLCVVTDSFRNKNILGRGGFGKVYKGRLAAGLLVAVKRLKEERTPGGVLQFQTEVEVISMAVHSNLLRLRSFCMTSTERLLVYSYMANGSVASCLRERPPGDRPLDWPTRKRIELLNT